MKESTSPKCPAPRSHQLLRAAIAGVCLLGGLEHRCAAADTNDAAATLQELRSFREMGTVLYVAAHPDDENTQLITYLSRGRGYRTAYLSVTRGDGGQK